MTGPDRGIWENPEDLEFAIESWTSGKTATWIGEQLGVTNRAVLHKMRRLRNEGRLDDRYMNQTCALWAAIPTDRRR